MIAMCPRDYLFHHNFLNNEHKNEYNISICIVFKATKLITLLYFRNKQYNSIFLDFNQHNLKYSIRYLLRVLEVVC